MKSTLKVLLIMVMGCIPAAATLGQYESSVSLDQKQMKSEDRVQVMQAYKVHELTIANGAVVREFVSPKGLVFGVSWQGPSIPDMQQLLGNYAPNLHTASPSQTQVRHMRGLIVKTKDFEFVSSGHMRSWSGHAYVPSLLPSDVSPEVVQ
ncbi:MAG TPA: DUF2844 domain-containing protein [Terriglobia bacterium]|nr:DUF2844 domain-containing protein [Terriglobia bacterium]